MLPRCFESQDDFSSVAVAVGTSQQMGRLLAWQKPLCRPGSKQKRNDSETGSAIQPRIRRMRKIV